MQSSAITSIFRTVLSALILMVVASNGARATVTCSTGGTASDELPAVFIANADTGSCTDFDIGNPPPTEFTNGFLFGVQPFENSLGLGVFESPDTTQLAPWDVTGYSGTYGSFGPSDSSFEVLDDVPSSGNPAATFIGLFEQNGIVYTISIEIIEKTDGINSVTYGNVTISGGAFDNPPGSSSNANAQRQSNANKSAGAAFGQASNTTQSFITQTQTQDRLLGNGNADNNQASLTGRDQNIAAHSATQLAMAYGKTIKRPSKNAWHSKDIINHYRAKHLAEQHKKEQRALAGLSKLGVTAEIAQPQTFKSKWDLWSAGGLTDVDSSRTGNTFDGSMVFGRSGFDYLVTDSFLIGAFGGYDKADADFRSFKIELDSTAKIAGGYFGYRLTRAMTGLPLDLIIDGQASHAWVDYDITDNETVSTGTFDATRTAGSLSLTAVILRSIEEFGYLRVLPKLGVTYTKEKQDGYTDSRGNVVASQSFSLGQLTFGTSVYVPLARGVEVFGRAEGQWTFADIGEITTATGDTLRPEEFGALLGGGVRATIDHHTTVRFDASAESLGQSDYEQYTVSGRVDFRF